MTLRTSFVSFIVSFFAATAPSVLAAQVPYVWSCAVTSVFFMNGETGALQNAGEMFVGKPLLVDLSAGSVLAPEGPNYYQIGFPMGSELLSKSGTTDPEGVATLIAQVTGGFERHDNDVQHVFMLDQGRGEDSAVPFQFMLPGEIVSGLCDPLNS